MNDDSKYQCDEWKDIGDEKVCDKEEKFMYVKMHRGKCIF
jgi:hypothetical protein